MKIHLFAPFFSGSHQRWAAAYARHSGHQVRLFTLPGRHWKWRMHGGAVQLAQQFLAQAEQPDLLLTTDMLDSATFLALTRQRTHGIPLAVYFHENQLTYPWSPTDEDVPLQRDRHYGWINYSSALAADAVLFNSAYHRTSFLDELPTFLRAFPDYQDVQLVDTIRQKSQVLALGMDLQMPESPALPTNPVPLLLWNHRWEYDKNPEGFFNCCQRLADCGLHFGLIVLGEQYAQAPPVFAQARELLADKIYHWGFAKDPATYQHWLRRADVLPVTSRQDFFGGSVVEALYANTYPLLPDRLAYPEHLPTADQPEHLYQNEEALFEKLAALLENPARITAVQPRAWVAHYDWSVQAPLYDRALAAIVPPRG